MSTLTRLPQQRTEKFPNRQVESRLSPSLALDIELLTDAFRRGERSADLPQRDGYIESLGKRLAKGTVRFLDHLLLFARNRFERGAKQEDVEAVFHAGLSIVRRWYEDRAATDSLETLVKNETIAQAHADVEQWDLARATPKEIAEAEEALSVHLIQLTRLVLRLRQMRYAAHVPAA